MDTLRETMARLRGPEGCPWDREQTHQTLRVPLIDETCELLDTIDRGDIEHMREELGDVLLQVVFHSQLAEERGDFTFDDVAAGINEKLIRRHPHVFGDGKLESSEAVLRQWEAIKAAEKKNGPVEGGLFKRLPPALPALMRANKVAEQIRKKGLIEEAEEEVEAGLMEDSLTQEEAGMLLYEMASACQRAGIDAETALREHTGRLVRELEKKQQG